MLGGERREGGVVGAAEQLGERRHTRDKLVGKEEGPVGGGCGALEARGGGLVAVAEHGETSTRSRRSAQQKTAAGWPWSTQGVGGGRG